MADLMIPIIFIVFMLIVIENMESPLFLMLISLLFMPIALLFLFVAGNYDTLFQAPLGEFVHSVVYAPMLGGIMATISIAASLRMIYLGRGFGEAVSDQ